MCLVKLIRRGVEFLSYLVPHISLVHFIHHPLFSIEKLILICDIKILIKCAGIQQIMACFTSV